MRLLPAGEVGKWALAGTEGLKGPFGVIWRELSISLARHTHCVHLLHHAGAT